MSQMQTTLLATEVIFFWQHNVMLLVLGQRAGHNADNLLCRAALLGLGRVRHFQALL